MHNFFLPQVPTNQDILTASKRIAPFVHKTPILTSSYLNDISGAELYFKCENFQKAGAFKFRGAINTVSSLPEEVLASGVATHSSGNHAGALALAAKMKGIPAHIVMPKTAPQVKVNAVKGYGANVYFCEPNQKAREDKLDEVVSNTGALFIHPYNNYSIIAGQATACLELLEETQSLDYVVAPVGGGGLLSGTALSAKYFSPITKVIAAEPTGADDAFHSVRDNKVYPSVNPDTICDGLLTSLGDKTFPIICDNVSEIITANDESIITAMRLVWERMKIIIEPSSAVPLAVVLNNPEKFAGKKVGIIISGGNVELGKLPF